MEPRDSFQCRESLEHDLARVLSGQVFPPGRNALAADQNFADHALRKGPVAGQGEIILKPGA